MSEGAAPSVCVIVPTRNSDSTLARALDSLARQDYEGELRLLVIDADSADETRAIARSRGAEVLHNPHRREEVARAIGLHAAAEELVLLLDADDELPTADWLSRSVTALQLGDDIVAADSLFHEWRRQDPPIVRLCALMGGSDPLAVELGWSDRWAWHLGRWTGMPILDIEEHRDAIVVRIDGSRPPPMGSNGFLVRREALLGTRFEPDFVHSDCVGDLAEQRYRFARVRQGIVHHYAEDLSTYRAKAARRAQRWATGVPHQRRGYRPGTARALAQVAFSASLLGPAALALRGFARHRDPAWALYPLLSAITVLAYARARLRVLIGR